MADIDTLREVNARVMTLLCAQAQPGQHPSPIFRLGYVEALKDITEELRGLGLPLEGHSWVAPQGGTEK